VNRVSKVTNATSIAEKKGCPPATFIEGKRPDGGKTSKGGGDNNKKPALKNSVGKGPLANPTGKGQK